MPMQIEGVTFYSVSDLTDELGVSRQTLWRWRSDRHVPPGRKYRNREVLFTETEVERIREYANRMEPIDPSSRARIRPFNRVIEGTRR